ncbi:hypothetical protein [Nocardia sp. BMG111209]|uniref:hypothetical protein n=1 Tax=Nocardia sp. BMG111209 TaxID=1160137 RepID=UPI0003729719|nr:hypothetical protein [Nocardia sp. BMG111209]
MSPDNRTEHRSRASLITPPRTLLWLGLIGPPALLGGEILLEFAGKLVEGALTDSPLAALFGQVRLWVAVALVVAAVGYVMWRWVTDIRERWRITQELALTADLVQPPPLPKGMPAVSGNDTVPESEAEDGDIIAAVLRDLPVDVFEVSALYDVVAAMLSATRVLPYERGSQPNTTVLREINRLRDSHVLTAAGRDRLTHSGKPELPDALEVARTEQWPAALQELLRHYADRASRWAVALDSVELSAGAQRWFLAEADDLRHLISACAEKYPAPKPVAAEHVRKCLRPTLLEWLRAVTRTVVGPGSPLRLFAGTGSGDRPSGTPVSESGSGGQPSKASAPEQGSGDRPSETSAPESGSGDRSSEMPPTESGSVVPTVRSAEGPADPPGPAETPAEVSGPEAEEPSATGASEEEPTTGTGRVRSAGATGRPALSEAAVVDLARIADALDLWHARIGLGEDAYGIDSQMKSIVDDTRFPEIDAMVRIRLNDPGTRRRWIRPFRYHWSLRVRWEHRKARELLADATAAGLLGTALTDADGMSEVLRLRDEVLAHLEYAWSHSVRPDVPGQVTLLLETATLHLRLGHPDAAWNRLTLAQALTDRGRDPSGRAHTFELMGVLWWMRGEPRRALRCWQTALDGYRALEHRLGTARCLQHLGSAMLVVPECAGLLLDGDLTEGEVLRQAAGWLAAAETQRAELREIVSSAANRRAEVRAGISEADTRRAEARKVATVPPPAPESVPLPNLETVPLPESESGPLPGPEPVPRPEPEPPEPQPVPETGAGPDSKSGTEDHLPLRLAGVYLTQIEGRLAKMSGGLPEDHRPGRPRFGRWPLPEPGDPQ